MDVTPAGGAMGVTVAMDATAVAVVREVAAMEAAVTEVAVKAADAMAPAPVDVMALDATSPDERVADGNRYLR